MPVGLHVCTCQHCRLLRIPDAPEELFRIPYEAAESDAIRYALLYHNGGIYMDTDFLAIDMSSIVDKRMPQLCLESSDQSQIRIVLFAEGW